MLISARSQVKMIHLGAYLVLKKFSNIRNIGVNYRINNVFTMTKFYRILKCDIIHKFKKEFRIKKYATSKHLKYHYTSKCKTA